MANHKSAAKRARQNLRKTGRNTATKSGVRSFERKLRQAIASKNAKDAQTALVEYMSKAGKAAQKGVMNVKAASRKISRLSAQVSQLAK